MTSLSLGYVSRFMAVDDVREAYDTPRKVCKIRRDVQSAENVAWLPRNRIVVCDKLQGLVKIYDGSGNFLDHLGQRIRPEGVSTTSSGMVAVVDIRRRRERCVRVFCDNGSLYSKWGDEFGRWKPKAVAFSSRGSLVVSQVGTTHSVGLYTVDGKELLRFGEYGNRDVEFNGPHYLTVDIFDRIIVSDRNNHAVKLFDERGTFLGKFGDHGTGKGQLRYPRGVCSDSRGNIFVCDTGNRRVSVFSLYGRFIQDILTSKQNLGSPFGISYNREANQLVVSQNYSNTDNGNLRKICVYQLDPMSALKIVRKVTTTSIT